MNFTAYGEDRKVVPQPHQMIQILPVRFLSILHSGNWEEIKYEISLSNVIQRDSAVFAKKLAKKLHEFANEKEEQVFISNFIIITVYIKLFS